MTLERIGDVVTRPTTWSPIRSRSTAPFHYIDIASVNSVEKSIVRVSDLIPAQAPSRARQLVRTGDILVSTVRPNLNAVAMVPPALDDATASTGFCVLRPDSSRIEGRYLFHWVCTPMFINAMIARATGASYPAISDRIVHEAVLPVPPLPEQRRIAAMLDKADAVRRKRRESLRLLDELIRSVFLEMFGDPASNDKGWPRISLGGLLPDRHLIVDGPFGSSLKPASYVNSGVRVIRNFNVKNDAFDHSAYKYITEEKFEHVRRSEVQMGDVLISTKGTLGNVCLMPDLAGHSVLSATGTVRLHLPSEDKMRRLFLVSQMVMPTYTRYLRGFEAGSNQKYLNLASIRRMSVILPPIELQDKFLHIRERVKSLAARQAAAEEESGSLFAAIASIAFGGDGV